MDLTLKDIRLAKDPLETERENSEGNSSCHDMRIEVQAKIDAIPDADYNLPQNDATVHGEFMFADQTVDAYVYDLSRPRQETYSPTGNSWNQSDIDSEFHNYDPKRYPPRGPPQKNPQDSESVAPTDNAS